MLPCLPLPGSFCSALYFSSLLILGIGLPAWAKPWKKANWAKLNCFKRRAENKLPAPATQPPAAAAVDAPAEEPAAVPAAAS